MKSIIEQLAEYLAGEGIGTLEGNDEGSVFWGTMPEAPKKAICVRAADMRQCGDAGGTQVMIYIRSDEDGDWPLQKSMEIMDLLDGLRHAMFTDGGNYILRVEMLTGATSGGLHANATQHYFMNFRIYYC